MFNQAAPTAIVVGDGRGDPFFENSIDDDVKTDGGARSRDVVAQLALADDAKFRNF